MSRKTKKFNLKVLSAFRPMKKFMFLLMAIGVFSCAPKKENMIAINVLLTPSEEMNQYALNLSGLIKKNNLSSMQLDKKHIPHITLLQCFVKEKDLLEIEKSLNGLFDTIKTDSLYASGLVYNKDTDDSFAMIQIDKSEALLKLHEEVIKRVKPFILKEGSESAFVPNPDGSPINQFTLAYVPKFVADYSFENFDPHISLGVAKKVFLDSLSENVFQPVQFKTSSLSIYQLGDSGTAQKHLWSSE